MKADDQFPVPDWSKPDREDTQIAFVIVVVSKYLQEIIIKDVKALLENDGVVVDCMTTLVTDKAWEIAVTVSRQQAMKLFCELSRVGLTKEFDAFVIPVAERDKKLLVCDMDSTIVQTETLDELALIAGIGDQVRQITERAMRGEIDFGNALGERVGLLAGMSADLLAQVAESTPMNEGAEKLIAQAKANGLRTVLVSGGFEPIVNVVAKKLGFDRYVCNKMEVVDGVITGKVLKPIVDSATKLAVLMEECERLNILPAQACTIGDGANDMQMIQAAGMGVSYYGKPVLRSATPYQINTSDLTSVLYAMGISG